MSGFRDFSTTTATFIPFGSFMYGSNSAQNTNNLIGGIGQGIGSLFKGATGMLGSPVVLIGGAVVVLILLK